MLEGLVQRNYEALNRRDLSAIMGWWADDAVFEFPGRTPVSGRFVGKPAIEAWWRRWVERYASVHFTVKHVAIGNPLGLTIANTLFVEWDVEVTTTDGISLQASAVSFTSMRHGKVIYARDYFFDPTALERIWGRVDEAPAATSPAIREPALASVE
jgi:ketosteroid isomerase-like protein